MGRGDDGGPGLELTTRLGYLLKHGVDRTTMVSLLDGLEERGLIARYPAAGDRRKNVVELTQVGHAVLRSATEASDEAERQFLSVLSAADGRRLIEMLRILVTGTDTS